MSTSPRRLAAAGIGLLTAGFLYDLAFAGLPYQDPTPAMAARFAWHSRIATILYAAGLFAVVSALILACLFFVRDHRR